MSDASRGGRVCGRLRTGGGCRTVGAGEDAGEVFFLELLEEFPEIGDEEGADDGVDSQAEDYGSAEADAAGGTGAGGEEHWHDAEDEGHAG